MLHRISSNQPAIQIASSENAHIECVKEAGKIYQALSKYSFKETKKEAEARSWNFPNLFLYLLLNFDKNKLGVEIINKARFHLFTYLQVDSSEKREDEKKDLIIDFLRLTRCQNRKYRVLPNDMENNAAYIQTFENIYVASCVEGTCMMLDSQGVVSDFFNGYKNSTFFARYLWIYLLVFLQRQTLAGLNKKVMNIDTDMTLDAKVSLGKIVSDLAKIKINSFFTNISDHTQHNTFYWICSDKILVNKYLKEINEKIEGVEIILREKTVQREEKQHEIFISYSSKDQTIANAIVNYLESNCLKCWIAYRDAEAGNAYASSIANAIKSCNFFVLVFSENSNNSKHVLREVNLAVDYENTLIPFKIDNSKHNDAMHYYLSSTHWLDATSDPVEAHFDKLVSLMKK
jgi:hypothetical protein